MNDRPDLGGFFLRHRPLDPDPAFEDSIVRAALSSDRIHLRPGQQRLNALLHLFPQPVPALSFAVLVLGVVGLFFLGQPSLPIPFSQESGGGQGLIVSIADEYELFFGEAEDVFL